MHWIFIFLSTFWLLGGCTAISENDAKCPGASIDPLPNPPHEDPVWHPGGEFIGFNHLPLREIRYKDEHLCLPPEYGYDYEQSGFWAIDPYGSNKRRLFPQRLQTPAWSPDGEWIAFTANAQIYKMRFTGDGFDTTTVTQLTFEGRNFYPSWSPDGEWIAYDRSIADESGPGGVWIMKYDGTARRPVFGGAFPTWHPDGQSLLAVIGTSVSSIWKRFVKHYPLNDQPPETLNAVVGSDNRYPKYSPDGTKIVFSSQPRGGPVNIWLMQEDGSGLEQLTNSWGRNPSWSTDGRYIVYLRFNWQPLDEIEGTLRIIDLETRTEHPLTLNDDYIVTYTNS